MTWVIPAYATFAMFSAVQIPPPTAIRSVTQVISIPIYDAFLFWDALKPAKKCDPHPSRVLCG